MVTRAGRRFIAVDLVQIIPVIVLGILSYLWTFNVVAAYDCAEAEVRCWRDSNCLLAMEAHRVTCGPLGTTFAVITFLGCVSADLNLCHAALVSLQLSNAFNGSCWCHEPTMEPRVYHRCLDVHLKIFYHPCIAKINSRINGRRREMDLEQQRKQETTKEKEDEIKRHEEEDRQEAERKRQEEEQLRRQQEEERRRQAEEEQRRLAEWHRYLWIQQQSITSSTVSPATSRSTAFFGAISPRTTSTSTAISEETLEAQRREQQRLEYERRLLEQRYKERLEEREREYQRRRQEWELQQRQRSTSTIQTALPAKTLPRDIVSRRMPPVTASTLTSTASSTVLQTRIIPTFIYKPEQTTSLETTTTVPEERTPAYFSYTETRYTGVIDQTYAFTLATPRHKIRHFQDKVDMIEKGEEEAEEFDPEGHARRHQPSTIVTGESINGHSLADFSNLFSPNYLDTMNGEQRARAKLSVPGENHWSCTKSLERCLDHVACTRLLDLYRDKCRVDNQRCVSTDWKSCKEAYEGIRWTGLNNCTCSDNHRLHGPSCHFVELLTAHNQCIDQFKREGLIADDNGAVYFGQPSASGVPPVTVRGGGGSRNSSMRPPSNVTRPVFRNTTIRPIGTGEMVITSSGQQPVRKPDSTPFPAKLTSTSTSTTTTPVKVTAAQKTSTTPKSTTTTKKTTAKVIPKLITTTQKVTTTTKPLIFKPITAPASLINATIRTRPPKQPQSTEKPKVIDEDEEKEEESGKVEKPQVYLPPQRYPLQPITRFPLITWDEWDKRRVIKLQSISETTPFKQISAREIALGAMTYRVDSTCQFAFSHCHWDTICSWQLSEIKSYCVTFCDKQKCASAISRFYKYVGADFQEGLTFCTCRAHDIECLEYQNLLFPSCLRQMQRHEWRECGDLKNECRNDERCWPWAELYFDACKWDSNRGRCAGSAQACRQAVLGIRGTPLDSDCACLPNNPECEAIQNALYFRNPCFEEARLTMLPKFTTRRPTTSSTTTTTTTTTKPTTTKRITTSTSTISMTSSTSPTKSSPSRRRTTSTTTESTDPTGDFIIEYPEEQTTSRSRTRTTMKPRITTSTTKRSTTTRRREPVVGVGTTEKEDEYEDNYNEEETTTIEMVTTTVTTENVTEETTTPTTPTTPPSTTPQTPQCVATDQETRTIRMRSGRSPVRIYKDRFTRCSSLCQCNDPGTQQREDEETEDESALIPEPILDCLSIDCMADIPCPGGTWLGYGAPSFRMTQDKCTCISGEFICRRPKGEWTAELAEEGLYMSIGYSQKEVEWLVQRLPHDINGIPVDFPHTIDEFLEEMRKELEKHMLHLADRPEDKCDLIEHYHEGNNFIFEVRRTRKNVPEGFAQTEYMDDFLLDEVCRIPVRRLEKALDEDKFRNDVILSVIKEVIVDDKLPTSGCISYCTQNFLAMIVLHLITCFTVIRWLSSCK